MKACTRFSNETVSLQPYLPVSSPENRLKTGSLSNFENKSYFRSLLNGNYSRSKFYFDYLDKSIEIISCKVIGLGLEFAHAFAHLDEADGGAIVLFQTEKFENTAVIVLVTINQNKKS